MSQYLDIIAERPLIWGLFGAYMAVTAFLAWLGHKKTTGLDSFAIGSGRMHPAIVGITLAASIASTATFVINPGFVYVHGLSALLHFGVAAGLGVVGGLVLLSPGFRRIGADLKAITLPQWVGDRFKSPALRLFFAAANMLSFTFVVLIVGGLAIVMQTTLGLGTTEAAGLVIIFVFGYVFVGGATAHAYTNTVQGVIMVFVAIAIVGSGLHLLGGDVGVLSALAATDPDLARAVNPSSPLFGSFFSVWVSGLVIGFAVVCQPHILTKALYVDSDRDVRRYLAVTICVSVIFSGLLLVGLYAHLIGMPAEAFTDPRTGLFRQDMVAGVYIAKTFGPTETAFITVALLAAGMSTLDGLLVALSSIAANDLFRPAARRWLSRRTPAQQDRLAHHAGQWVLVAMGVGAFVVVLDPPRLLGIFGQVGVYGIACASCAPVLCGVLFRKAPTRPIAVAAAAALLTHFGLWTFGNIANPAVTATWGVLVSLGIALPATWIATASGPSLGPRRAAELPGS